MKTGIINEFGEKIHFVESDIPKPKEREVLVELKYCGCCHTDLHAVKGDWSCKPKLPLCPGHEGVGIVSEVGDKVKNLKVGDRVGIPWLHSSCGECEYCSSGWETLCTKQETSGYSVDGCYRQFTTIPASHAVKLPDNKPLEEAAPILCAGVTVYKSLLETEAKPGQFVCILGAAGGLGHLGIQYAKAMGFRVIAMDLGKDKVEFMKTFEPELALDVNDPDSKNIVKEYTQGGVHAVVVIATQASAFEYAIELCRNKAYIVATSMPQGNVEIDIVPLVLKRITFRGSVVGTRNDMTEAMDYFARGMIKPNISVVPFEQVNEVLDQFHSNKIQGRVVLQM